MGTPDELQERQQVSAKILVRGARDQNLKGVDLDLEHGRWTAVVGPSGSGKSTLVFGTLVREGERRYLGAHSTKARQFFGKLGRADVESLGGLPVPIAVGHRSITSNPRSTVGTQSGLLDVLRLVFARSAIHPDGETLHRSHFSFNHAAGACEACGGLGLEDRVDPDLIVADASRSIRGGALVPTLKSGYTVYSQVTLEVMDQIAHAHGFDVDTPWNELTDEQRGVVLYGTRALKVPFGKHGLESRMKWKGITARPREEGYYRGIVPVIQETLLRSRNDNILRFVESAPCSACGGSRLGPLGRAAQLGEVTLPQLLGTPAAEFSSALEALPESPVLEAVAATLHGRARRMVELGLGHLTLDRTAASLSAGEAQRLRLVAHLGAGLSGVLYALDEPTLGLHPEAREGMAAVLGELVDSGNTLLVVEHDPGMVRCADTVVSLGPGAGPHGGEVVDVRPGPNANLGTDPESLREKLLADRPEAADSDQPVGQIRLTGATLHNLQRTSLHVTIGALNVVTGPSGAGKTSLVFGTLLPALEGRRGGPFEALIVEEGTSVHAIDARPMGRSSRSTPATWCGNFDAIRKLFAAVPAAQDLGLKVSHFSFNAKGGRCGACEGLGVRRVGLHLLEDAVQPCARCGGRRYGEEVLAVRWHGATIADVLALSAEDALEFFQGHGATAAITAPLAAMVDLGAGYLRLGMPSTELSSGESQRIRLATLLAKERTTPTLFVFDEPDRGLDPRDVERLLRAFHGLVERGHTVLAVSHHRHVWAGAHALSEVRDGVCRSATWEDLRTLGQGAPGPGAGRPDEARASAPSSIELRGVRTHNLNSLDVGFRHRAVTAITGVSGSGKTSLVFDTLAAEAWHRYSETLPFQVRRFLHQLPRPDFDSAEGLTPVVALRQVRGNPSERSTVATLSGLGPLVRLVFARAARVAGEVSGLSMAHFSAERPEGACAECGGRGEVRRATLRSLLTDPALPLSGGAFGGTKAGAFFTEPDGQYVATLRLAAEHDLEGPWEGLPERVREIALHGTGSNTYDVRWSFQRGARRGEHRFSGPWEGLLNLVEREVMRRAATKTGAPWLAALESMTCDACGGLGLGPGPRAARLGSESRGLSGSLSFKDVLDCPLDQLMDRLDAAAADHPAWLGLKAHLEERVAGLVGLGLGSFGLGTRAHELSMGDLQRLRLAGVLDSGLTGVTLVLDEPGAGLGDHELELLSERLGALCQRGNTVLMVTHREALIRRADHVLTLGPGAGADGGRIVDGSAHPGIGAVERAGALDPILPMEGGGPAELPGLPQLPSSGLVILEGPGASAGTVLDSLADGAPREPWDQLVDARAAIRAQTPLSAFDAMPALQSLFSAHSDLPKAAFSFGSPKGRCPECSGRGFTGVALDFMAELSIPCEACGGSRYRPEVLEVQWNGMNVAQFLETPVSALEGLTGRLRAAAESMLELGLGHLGLGRRSATLSGGEAQRLALATGFAKASPDGTRTLYLLDHPATGLAPADLGSLVGALRKRAKRGDLFLATAHRAELISVATQVATVRGERLRSTGRPLPVRSRS